MSVIQRAAAVEALFPRGVIAFDIRGDLSTSDHLFPSERRAVATAAATRVREFAAGRLCARAALLTFGFKPGPLLPRQDRRPHWPAGIVGSITHTADYCVAVLGPKAQFSAIGVDAERIKDVGPPVWPQILHGEEIAKLHSLDPSMRQRVAAITHCAKEAFYKFQYELTGSWLGFEDVSVDIDGEVFEVTVHKEHPIRQLQDRWIGSFRVDETMVIAAIAAEGLNA